MKFLITNSMIFIMAISGYSQQDGCVTSGAGEITVNSSCTFTTFNSTNNVDYWNSASGCGADDSDDAWGWFTATSTETTITFDPDANDDAVISLFTGTCSTGMSSIDCVNDLGNGGTEVLTYSTTVGQVYMVRIQKLNGNSNADMNGQLCVYEGAPVVPGNGDSCSDAVILTPGTQQCGTNSSAGDFPSDGSSPSNPCNGSYNDGEYWFEYTATGDALQLDVSGLTATWSGLFVLDDCPSNSPSCIASYTSGSSTADFTLTTSALTNGQTYYIVLANFGTPDFTDFCLDATEVTPPGLCSGDVTINTTAYSATGLTTCGFGNDYGSTDACGSDYMTGEDIVFAYTPTTSECISITLSNTDTYTGVFVTTNCPDELGSSCITSSTSYTGNPYINQLNVTAGTTYFITVSTYPSPNCTDFDLDIAVCPPPPSNDDCSGAISVTVNPDQNCGTVTSGTVLNATASSEVNDCFGTPDDDVWYSFVATNTAQTIDISNVSGSVTDMYHSVYSGACGSFDPVLECSDGNSSIVNGLTIGDTYYVRVYTYTSTGGQNTTFDICVGTPPPPPSNDECSGSITLTVNPDYNCDNSTSGTIQSATASSEVNDCFGTPDDDVWYSFTATNSIHTVDIYNIAGSTTDMYHSIYSGSCGGSGFDPVLECSDANSSVVTSLTPGDVYYVRVYTYTSTSGQTTDFDICIGTPPPPPGNDECNSAVSVTVNTDGNCTYTESGTVGSATASSQSNDCYGTADDDVWYSFVATSTDINVNLINITGSTTDLYHSVYESSNCNSLGTPVECSDPNFSTLTGLTVGDTYFVRVYSYTSTSLQTTSFDICVSHAPPAPTNVTCPQMQPICSGQPIAFTAQSDGSDAEAGNNYDCLSTYPNPSWYYLEIAQSGDLAIDLTAGDDVDFALWGPYTDLATAQGECGSLPLPVDCSYSSSEIELADRASVVAGEVYLLLVTNYADITQTIFLNEAPSMTAETNCAIVVLPAELEAINALRIENKVLLSWVISSELNCDYYEIQKSQDGLIWQTIGVEKGQGSTDQITNYQFEDNRPWKERSLYRYKQVDFDGHFKYSPVQVVEAKAEQLTLYPVPAKTLLTCDLGDVELNSVKMADLSGKQLQLVYKIDQQKLIIDVKDIKDGFYLLQLETDEGIQNLSVEIAH